MPPIAVESTLLTAVAYDPSQRVLHLQFHGGAVYKYLGVPAEIQQALLSAPSKGRYFNQAIRGRFPFTRQFLS